MNLHEFFRRVASACFSGRRAVLWNFVPQTPQGADVAAKVCSILGRLKRLTCVT